MQIFFLSILFKRIQDYAAVKDQIDSCSFMKLRLSFLFLVSSQDQISIAFALYVQSLLKWPVFELKLQFSFRGFSAFQFKTLLQATA